jgi:hypothetical protein
MSQHIISRKGLHIVAESGRLSARETQACLDVAHALGLIVSAVIQRRQLSIYTYCVYIAAGGRPWRSSPAICTGFGSSEP